MKKTIKLKSPEGEVKEFRTDENVLLWKVLGGIMLISGVIELFGVPYQADMYSKVYDTISGALSCYLGVYGARELTQIRKLVIKKHVEEKGFVAADEEAEQYLLEKDI